MSRLFAAVFSLLCAVQVQSICEGGSLDAVSAVGTRFAGCAHVGSVIANAGTGSNIGIDLPALVSVDNVLIGSSSWVSVSPLKHVERITGTLSILNNALLLNLSDFAALRNLTDLEVTGNSLLVNLDGFQRLTKVSSSSPGFPSLKIAENPQLRSLFGLESLRNVSGPTGNYILIRNNVMLSNITAFSSLTTLPGLHIENCPIASLAAFSSVVSPFSYLYLRQLPISSVYGLHSIPVFQTSLPYSSKIELSGLPNLNDTSALPPIDANGGLYSLVMNALPNVTDCPAAFLGLTTVDDLEILDVRRLRSLSCFSGIRLLRTYLYLTNLQSVSGGLPFANLVNFTAPFLIFSFIPLNDTDFAQFSRFSIPNNGYLHVESVATVTNISLPNFKCTSLNLFDLERLAFVDVGFPSAPSDIAIRYMPLLQALPAQFSSIKTVTSFSLHVLPLISSMPSLSNVTALAGTFQVTSLVSLTSLPPWNLRGHPLAPRPTIILGTLPTLVNISSLFGIRKVNILDFSYVPVRDLSGLKSMDDISELKITYCSEMITLDGLSNVTTLFSLRLNDNDKLLTLGLTSLRSVEMVQMNRLSSLRNFGGLLALTQIGTDIIVDRLPRLTSIASLCSLTSVGYMASFTAMNSLCCAQGNNIFARVTTGNGPAVFTSCIPTGQPGCEANSAALDACTGAGLCVNSTSTCVQGACDDARACRCTDDYASGALCDVIAPRSCPPAACSFAAVQTRLNELQHVPRFTF